MIEDIVFMTVFIGSVSTLFNLIKHFSFKNKYFIKKFDMATQTEYEELEEEQEDEYLEPEIIPIEPVKPKKKGIFW
jgi:hypothetical protein